MNQKNNPLFFKKLSIMLILTLLLSWAYTFVQAYEELYIDSPMIESAEVRSGGSTGDFSELGWAFTEYNDGVMIYSGNAANNNVDVTSKLLKEDRKTSTSEVDFYTENKATEKVVVPEPKKETPKIETPVVKSPVEKKVEQPVEKKIEVPTVKPPVIKNPQPKAQPVPPVLKQEPKKEVPAINVSETLKKYKEEKKQEEAQKVVKVAEKKIEEVKTTIKEEVVEVVEEKKEEVKTVVEEKKEELQKQVEEKKEEFQKAVNDKKEELTNKAKEKVEKVNFLKSVPEKYHGGVKVLLGIVLLAVVYKLATIKKRK